MVTVQVEAAASVSSAERPGLQVHDSKVIGFREATVVEGEAGAAAAEIQILIHPQTKVTTEERKYSVVGPHMHIVDYNVKSQ